MLTLSPMTEAETAELVDTLSSQAALPMDTRAVLLERAGGNPLYAEEFVRMLLDRGFLGRREPVAAVAPEGEIPVTETVKGLIALFLDTLSRDRKMFFFFASRRRHTRWPRDWSSDECSSDLALGPVEPAVVPAAEDALAPGRHTGEPHRRGHCFGPGLQETHLLEPRDPHGERIGQLFLEHRRQRTRDAGGDRPLGGAVHLRVAVAQRHGAERHDVVHVLAALRVPHTAARRALHARRQSRVLARRLGAEQRVGSLATGRRESRNAPVAHRISPPRSPWHGAASPRARRAARGGSARAPSASRSPPGGS